MDVNMNKKSEHFNIDVHFLKNIFMYILLQDNL